MWSGIVAGCVLTFVLGCSDDEPDPAPAPTGGAPVASGGSTSSGGRVSSGGSANGGIATGGTSAGGTAAGGRATSGGRAGTGGRPSGGTSSTGGAGGRSGGTGGSNLGGVNSDAPTGPVETCFGDACPLGECDNGGFFADVDCSDVYPGPVDEDSEFCATDLDGGYCLTIVTNAIARWAVACAGGTETLDFCDGGCGVQGGMAQCR